MKLFSFAADKYRFSLSVLDKSIFGCAASEGGFWFRIFGKGASICDRSKHPPLFSERKGLKKGFRFGKWRVNFLFDRGL
ncbi:MAG: hypothetical protein HWQ38_18935 [Nostoc sp. NMS7]|uniref:hypothetical protein n=1 Tax=Nostoc sp. NMS7 TaxID=2815391 RepID=UPI0026004840|nr:hypothetical protein [Nostoc sp. NMS7]MBN3948412.1 hypothetical protein [Nostoc sp. NMS7]